MFLNGTVLTASWDAPAKQNVSYTLTCSVTGGKVFSLNTTMTEVMIGIYETEVNYSCHVYATVDGKNEPATDDQHVQTGGIILYNTIIMKHVGSFKWCALSLQTPVNRCTCLSFHE